MNIKLLKKTLAFTLICISIALILLLFSLFKGIASNQIISVLFLTLIFTFGFLYKQTWLGRLGFSFALFMIIIQAIIYDFFIAIIFLVITPLFIIAINLFVNYFRKVIKTRTYNIRMKKNTTLPAHISSNYWLEPYHTQDSFDWENINISTLFGDTIINLTNTILPDGTSIISIHKAIGNTRIVAPIGVGISLMVSSFYSNIFFEGENYSLKQEQLTIYSNDYIQSSRKIKIIITTYIGDVEIINL